MIFFFIFSPLFNFCGIYWNIIYIHAFKEQLLEKTKPVENQTKKTLPSAEAKENELPDPLDEIYIRNDFFHFFPSFQFMWYILEYNLHSQKFLLYSSLDIYVIYTRI